MTRRLGLDLDGVCYCWSDTAALLIRYHHGIEVGPSTSWNHIWERVPTHVWDWLWADGVKKHGLFRHGNSYPGTFEALDELSASGWDIVVLTCRPTSALVDTLDWLAYHRIPTREVRVLGEEGPKSSVPCDLYVDDNPANIADTVSVGRSLLWTRSWNVNEDITTLGPRASRVETWRDVLRVAKEEF